MPHLLKIPRHRATGSPIPKISAEFGAIGSVADITVALNTRMLHPAPHTHQFSMYLVCPTGLPIAWKTAKKPGGARYPGSARQKDRAREKAQQKRANDAKKCATTAREEGRRVRLG